MTLTLRSRILLLLVPPLLILLALAGAAGVTILHLGGRINAILRENYDSVIAMQILNEALERIDSAFQFALADQEEKARQQFGLQGRGQIADFVKKQRASLGRRHLAQGIAHRAGEGALNVAEQLALQ